MFKPKFYTTEILGNKTPGLDAQLIQGMRKSKKFLMPDNGVLFEDTTLSRYSPMLKLPFAEVTLEYQGTFNVYGRGPMEIQICLFATEARGEQEQGATVAGLRVTVFYALPGKKWIMIPVHVFLPEKFIWPETKEEIEALTARFVMHDENMPHADVQNFGAIVMRESLSLFQFCAAMNCSNVLAESRPAPKFINSKRTARGKEPLYEYHILTVDVGHRNEHGEAQGGHHASPREHIRRGHIRRYKSGLTIWINQMMVGRRELGKVEKDYKLVNRKSIIMENQE